MNTTIDDPAATSWAITGPVLRFRVHGSEHVFDLAASERWVLGSSPRVLHPTRRSIWPGLAVARHRIARGRDLDDDGLRHVRDPEPLRATGHPKVSERDKPAGHSFDLVEGRDSASADQFDISGPKAEGATVAKYKSPEVRDQAASMAAALASFSVKNRVLVISSACDAGL